MSAVRSSRYEAKKKNWKCYKTISSYVSCAFIKIWSNWEVWRALKKLELLLTMLRVFLSIFRALQTSRVLHISMNVHWRMNQLLIVMCDNEFETKEKNIWTKDKIEPQHR